MNRYGHIIVILMVISLSLLSGSKEICAQPFRIGASQKQQKMQQQVLCSSQGRFAFGQISDSSRDQFMLDTFTGRLWRIAETGEVGLFLTPVPYRNKEGKCSPLPENISDPGSKKTEERK